MYRRLYFSLWYNIPPPLSFCCPEIGCFGQWPEPCFSPSVVRQQALFLPHQSTTTHVFAEVFPFTFRRPFSLNKAISRQLSPTIAKYLCSLCRLPCFSPCRLSCAASHVLISAQVLFRVTRFELQLSYWLIDNEASAHCREWRHCILKRDAGSSYAFNA